MSIRYCSSHFAALCLNGNSVLLPLWEQRSDRSLRTQVSVPQTLKYFAELLCHTGQKNSVRAGSSKVFRRNRVGIGPLGLGISVISRSKYWPTGLFPPQTASLEIC